jgi:hypothetical protein
MQAMDFSNTSPTDGYYAECDRYKPFNSRTINAMVDKKYIKINSTACDNTIYYVVPAENFNKLPVFTWNDYHRAK